MRGFALVLASLVMLGSVAAAAPNQEPAQPEGYKDSGTAIGLSAGLEVGSFVLMFSGAGFDNKEVTRKLALAGLGAMTIAPTTGHWYAGAVVTPGLVARLAAVGAGTYIAMSDECWLSLYGECEKKWPGLVMTGAVFLWIGGTVADFATLRKRVREHNEGLSVHGVAPVVNDDGGGVAIMGSF